jgi:hypothetical protein
MDDHVWRKGGRCGPSTHSMQLRREEVKLLRRGSENGQSDSQQSKGDGSWAASRYGTDSTYRVSITESTCVVRRHRCRCRPQAAECEAQEQAREVRTHTHIGTEYTHIHTYTHARYCITMCMHRSRHRRLPRTVTLAPTPHTRKDADACTPTQTPILRHHTTHRNHTRPVTGCL